MKKISFPDNPPFTSLYFSGRIDNIDWAEEFLNRLESFNINVYE